HEELSRSIYDSENKISSLTEERENLLVELAAHYLPEMTAQTIKTTLSEVRAKVESIFKQKQHRRQQLETAMQVSVEKESSLEEKLQEVTEQLNQKAEERDKTQSKILEELNADVNYVSLKKHFLQENEKLLRGQKRVQEAQSEAEKKLPAYKENKLFMYLLERVFGTQDYKSNGIIKKLDSWVAGIINYEQNRQNYEILRSMPKLIQEEVKKQEDQVKDLSMESRLMEEKIEIKNGLSKILQEGKLVGKTRDEIINQIQELDKEQERYDLERKDLDSKKDPYHQEAVQQLKAYLKGKEISDLKERARQTPGSEDDTICSNIEKIDQRIRSLKDQTKDNKSERDKIEQKVEGLKSISSRYTRKDYESGRSYFPGGFDIDTLLSEYLSGRYTTEILWEKIDSRQKFKPREVEYSSSSYGGSS
ncbi:MAG: hypothetical protein AABY22_32340, partial [Nanoarchaeota archaeon]